MDALRSWIRGFLGYRSPLYVFMAKILFFYYAISRGGVAGLKLIGMRARPGPGVWMKFRKLMFPIFIRPGTADIESVIDNIFREEYGQFPKGFSPRTIVDAGAYIGDTSAYFLSRFMGARLTALEPNLESYQLAQNNLAGYGDRVVLMQRALWEVECIVHLAGQETGASVSDHGFAVETTTIPGLLNQMGVDQLDLVKMDIEGAEITVLKSGVNGWLKQVRVLLLETHGKEIEDTVIPLLREEGFRIQRHRNVWYCFNQKIS